MNLSIKNIKYSEFASEETFCFSADLYKDNTKIAYCKNDGRGGMTFCQPYENKKNILRDIENYFKTLPHIVFPESTIENTLDLFVDKAISDYVINKDKSKFNNKLKKDMLKNICWGIPNSDRYKSVGWGSKNTIAAMKMSIVGTNAINKAIESVKSKLLPNEVILNDNI